MPTYIWQQKDWPSLSWDSSLLLAPLAECRRKQGKLLAMAEGLGLEAGRRAQAEAMTKEAVTTAEIEGVCLDPEAVRSSVGRRLGLPEAGLSPQDRTVEGLVDILFDASEQYASELTTERLFGWHAALFSTGYSGLKKITVAGWRPVDIPMRILSGPVGKEKTHFVAPGGDRVPREMERFISWWKSSRGGMDGLLRAGMAHLYFVSIHPFEDGNGRLARALTDMAMAQDEASPLRFYSLSAQMRKERKAYYAALEQAQKGSCDITAWQLWFLECFSRAIYASDEAIGKARRVGLFWQRLEPVQFNPRQRKVLGKLLEAGPGGFTGGMTNRKYRAMTRASNVTASRDLAQLVACGALRRVGGGRSVRYELDESPAPLP
jgi:Fic family protein